jgi:hypothetical protein
MLLDAAIYRGPAALETVSNTNTPRGHPEDAKRQFTGMDRIDRIERREEG